MGNCYPDEREIGLAPAPVRKGLPGSPIRGAEPRIICVDAMDRMDVAGGELGDTTHIAPGSCVIGEGVQRRRTVNEHEQRLIASISKSMAVMCVRNTTLEDIHAGVEPVSHTGDFSDVVVIDANGRRIPWPQVSRIGNERWAT